MATKRKSSIRKMTKNPPIFRVREAITFTHGGHEYTEINVSASLHRCAITLYNTQLPFLQRPVALDVTFEWEWYDWLYRPQSEHSLREQVEKIDALFVKGEVPAKLTVRPTQFPSVLV